MALRHQVLLAVATFLGLGCGSESDSELPDAAMCSSGQEIGGQPGQRVPDMNVQSCDGSTVSLLATVCGKKLTLVDIGGASFEQCVTATDAYATDPTYDDLQARGLQIVQIFTLDDEAAIPTTLFCEEYSQAHSIDFAFLIDQVRNTSLLTETYPFNLVLDADGVVLHRWHETIPEDKATILSDLLGQ